MQTKQAERLCTVALMLLIVIPLFRMNADSFLELFSGIDLTQAPVETDTAQNVLKEAVEAKTALEIQRKGEMLGMEIAVSVTAMMIENIPYPEQAMITGAYSIGQKQMLSDFMEQDLGIAAAHQIWDS